MIDKIIGRDRLPCEQRSSLFWLTARSSLSVGVRPAPREVRGFLLIVSGAGYEVRNECHQTLVPDREVDFVGAGADILGVAGA